MAELSWCLKQKRGIESIEPNENLCQAYFKEADDSLAAVKQNLGKWKIIASYYACYSAVYAVLMKMGIKSEIHECTITLMPFLGFDEEQIRFLKSLKDDRIEVQYYLGQALLEDITKIKSFIVFCKNLALKLDEDAVKTIRRIVKND